MAPAQRKKPDRRPNPLVVAKTIHKLEKATPQLLNKQATLNKSVQALPAAIDQLEKEVKTLHLLIEKDADAQKWKELLLEMKSDDHFKLARAAIAKENALKRKQQSYKKRRAMLERINKEVGINLAKREEEEERRKKCRITEDLTVEEILETLRSKDQDYMSDDSGDSDNEI